MEDSCVFTATSCVVTIANTQVECKSQVGIGADHHWRLEKAAHDWKGIATIMGVSTSYIKPTVTKVESTDVKNKNVLTTYGSEMITITGTNFGPAQLTTMMPSYLGKITGSYKNNIGYQYSTMSGEDCKVTIDHTQMTCTSVAGVGKDFKWRLTVASQTSAESTVTTRYRKPEIYSLDGPGAFEANTAGNTIANNDNTQGEKYYKRLKEVFDEAHGKPYDGNWCHWLCAGIGSFCRCPCWANCCFRREKKTFWCSALVAFIYVRMGWLPEKLDWSNKTPGDLSSIETLYPVIAGLIWQYN